MLKFSGFANLTSCLEWNQYNWNLPGKWPATEQRMTHKCYSNCLLWSTPVHWMRQRHEALWHTNTHTWQHQTSLVQCVRGMNINRHWSRHAFRDIPKAQYTFKSLLVHGILQFTMLITLRCALHRCSSRDIRRWKLCLMQEVVIHPKQNTVTYVIRQITVASQYRKTVLYRSTTREPVHEEADVIPLPIHKLIKGSSQWNKWISVNDPSAGSPTETLLRLLLPLSDKVH